MEELENVLVDRVLVRRRKRRRGGLFAIAVAIVVATGFFGLARHNASPPPPPPPPTPFRVIFPEGFTRAQMAARVGEVAKIANREGRGRVHLSTAGYLAASRSAVVPCFGTSRQTHLEGFLFPATYDFLPATTNVQLVRAQIKAFCADWVRLDLSYATKKNLTAYDILRIASMIEREAAAPVERPLVSAVIYNRLHLHMPLGIDATLRYGLDIPPTQSILQSQLASANPYNTRRFAGLPPTPIANPGLPSIEAAAHPARVNYLYYARKPGTNRQFFTASSAAFNQFLAANGYGAH